MTEEKKDLNPVKEMSDALVAAFDHFNEKLFDGKLPRTMVMFTRNSKVTGGYFSEKKWFNSDGAAVHEITINANNMVEGNDVMLHEVLIHEMLHEWQHEFGKPSRPGYHNQEWAEKAKAVGLKPSSANDPECETGDRISTKLIEGGKAMLTIAHMPDSIEIPWYAVPMVDPDLPTPKPGEKPGGDVPPPEPEKQGGKRTKYTCVKCGANLWGKSKLNIQCLDCGVKFVETKV
jgi:predicted SprT family Zn-dependent metalloprotease